MKRLRLLCAEEEVLAHPEMMGLEGERLDALEWVLCVHGAEECRSAAESLPDSVGVWIVSCDDMDAVNLAAALKRDDPDRNVSLVSFSPDGSLSSRASQAGIDGVLDEGAFKREFATWKAMMRGFVAAEGPMREGVRTVGEFAEDDPCDALEERAMPSLEASVPRMLSHAPDSAEARGKAIGILSASGGSGKSTVAALCAIRAVHLGLSAVIVDADLQFGDIACAFGVKDPLSADEALRRPDLVTSSVEGAPAVVGPPASIEDAEAAAIALPALVRKLKARFDVVVINTGSFWTDVHAAILDCTDAVVFVLDQRSTSLKSTVRAVELCGRLGAATSSFSFLVNRYEESGLITIMDASCALHGAHVGVLPRAGREVEELFSSGCLIELTKERNALCDALAEAVDPLLPGIEPRGAQEGKAKRWSPFGFLRKKEACA